MIILLQNIVQKVMLCSSGFFVDVCYQVLLYTWSPHPDQMWLFYIIPALYGIADGIWQTQINCEYINIRSLRLIL